MKKIISIPFFTGIFLFCSMLAQAKIKGEEPAYSLTREYISVIQILSDTIPAPVKPAEATSTKPAIAQPVATIIKTVPKARKVSVPQPVVVKVKPVKIIRPKITSPILRVL